MDKKGGSCVASNDRADAVVGTRPPYTQIDVCKAAKEVAHKRFVAITIGHGEHARMLKNTRVHKAKKTA
jgi:hypothetical protein